MSIIVLLLGVALAVLVLLDNEDIDSWWED